MFLLVSHKETFGLSYIEALIQARPLVYSKGQGIDGYFDEGRVGFHACADSVDDIANKIEMAIKDYDSLSKNTLEAVDAFRWSNIAGDMFKIYKEAIK